MSDIVNFTFSNSFIQKINVVEKQEILKEHNQIISDLQIFKGVETLQLDPLSQQAPFIQIHCEYLQYAMEINELNNSLLKAQSMLEEQLENLGPELSSNFWVNFAHVISDFYSVLARRFGSGEGDFSKHTLPHLPLLHSTDFLLFSLAVIIPLSLMIPMAGLGIAAIVIAALLLTSLVTTLLSVIRKTNKGDPDEQERTDINEQLVDIINQIEALFKDFNEQIISEESPIAANQQQAPKLLHAASTPAALSSQSMFTNRIHSTNEDFDSELQFSF